MRPIFVTLIIWGCATRYIAAQDSADAATNAPAHIGAFAVTPSLSITNFGLDSNVYNDANHAKRDLTTMITPSAQVRLRVGPAILAVRSRVDAMMFKQYSDQNTVSTVNSGRLDLALHRVQPFVARSFLRINDRPSAEIDARVRRLENTATVGTNLQLSHRIAATFTFDRAEISFAENGSAVEQGLREALNRTQHLYGAGAQYAVTPLTAVGVRVEREETQFPLTPLRNGRGLRVTPVVEFKPGALVSGRIRVGVLSYHTGDPQGPRFMATTAAVDVRSIIRGDNELTAAVERDLQYSAYTSLYFLQTRASVSVARRLNERWSISGSTSNQWLAYSSASSPRGEPVAPDSVARPDAGAAAGLSPQILFARPDRVLAITAGVGLHLTRGPQLGFGVTYSRRDAADASGRYANLRALGTVTYGAH